MASPLMNTTLDPMEAYFAMHTVNKLLHMDLTLLRDRMIEDSLRLFQSVIDVEILGWCDGYDGTKCLPWPEDQLFH